MYDLAESSFIFSCRESHPRQSQEAPPLSLFRRLRGTSETRSRHQFSPCCHSRAQIFRLVRRISIYLIYMFPTSRRRRRRIAQLNTIRSVLVFFSFFFAIILRSPRARSIDVYDAKAQSASFFCLLESLHDYGLLKLFDREGTEFSRPTTETFS